MTTTNKYPLARTFTSREAYLAYRAEWRAEYAQTSKAIRETKLEIKRLFRANEPAASKQMMLSILRDTARRAMQQRTDTDSAYREQRLAALAAEPTKAVA